MKMQFSGQGLGEQLVSLIFITLAIVFSSLLVAIIAYDAGFADGVTDTLENVSVVEMLGESRVSAGELDIVVPPNSFPVSLPEGKSFP